MVEKEHILLVVVSKLLVSALNRFSHMGFYLNTNVAYYLESWHACVSKALVYSIFLNTNLK